MSIDEKSSAAKFNLRLFLCGGAKKMIDGSEQLLVCNLSEDACPTSTHAFDRIDKFERIDGCQTKLIAQKLLCREICESSVVRKATSLPCRHCYWFLGLIGCVLL